MEKKSELVRVQGRSRKSAMGGGHLSGGRSIEGAEQLEPEQVRALAAAAARARRRAAAPYSGFQVGAALLTRAGKIFTGANVESASYGLTCCAERVALFRAVTEGERDFAAVAVVARISGGPMPCGACRQLLAEYAPAAWVYVADSRAPRRIRTFTVRELLPSAFTGAILRLRKSARSVS